MYNIIFSNVATLNTQTALLNKVWCLVGLIERDLTHEEGQTQSQNTWSGPGWEIKQKIALARLFN